MKSILIDIIAGARPNFMKIAPIMKAFSTQKLCSLNIELRLIHTGQHYDSSMSGDFFRQLGIPDPQVNLGVGSGSHAAQTAAIMVGYEQALMQKRPDMCIVVGDVNSTMACAIAAKKSNCLVSHVEAGIRSGDISMPEEINRIVTDSITDYFFTTTKTASDNLLKFGANPKAVFLVGNTMIDTLLQNLGRLRPPAFWNEHELRHRNYFVLTLHRPDNVDQETKLRALIQQISGVLKDHICIFPVHPRTATTLGMFDVPSNVIVTSPLPYLEFTYLLRHSVGVITDSGGITEEATFLKIPCITMRENTERPETVTVGSNEIVGSNFNLLENALLRIISGNWKKSAIPPYWDGNAAVRIVDVLCKEVFAVA